MYKLLVDIIKCIMSVIDIKKMIPIKSGVYTIVNLNKENTDTKEILKYKALLKRFCCDFRALKQFCDTYII